MFLLTVIPYNERFNGEIIFDDAMILSIIFSIINIVIILIIIILMVLLIKHTFRFLRKR